MNRFQCDLLKELIDLISPAVVGDVSISIAKGPNEPVIETKLISRQLSFWIYEDGAQIAGEGIDIRFEAESHREPSELAKTFLKKASEVLKG
jgi:hypothetical protein